MITTKKELKEYLKLEKQFYGSHLFIKTLFYVENAIIWKLQKRLRKTEFYKNTNRKIFYYLSLRWLNKLENRYSMHIPCNCFGQGLHIMHLGPILVNGKVRVGNNCSIHINTVLGARGTDDSVPVIGNDVVIGVGATLLGGISIANGIAIGANSLVNKSFMDENIAIAGIPAKKISNNGTREWKKQKKI
ncbi:MAG: hypothetical protein SPE59_03345 [Treponema sp.]|nr:hypothetical protein [Treponema sp.]